MSSPTGVGQSPALLLLVAEKLHAAGVPFCVIGALAAAYHGVVRASLDADLVVFSPTSGFSAERIFTIVKDAAWTCALQEGDAFDPISAVVLVEDVYHNRVDILFGVRGIFPDCIERASLGKLLGTELRFLSLEDFIVSKLSAGGPQDLSDIREALAISGSNVDQELLMELSGRLGEEEKNLLNTMLFDQRSS